MATKTKEVKSRPLTRKQAAFVKELIDNPKNSATEAAARTYNATTRRSAEAIATENLAKPSIRTELAKHNNMVESALITTIHDWKDESNTRKREIAMDVAKFVHDKVNGRATQKVDVHSEAVVINIDMGSLQQVETSQEAV